MTSSLVGSEMCIRDSVIHGPLGAADQPRLCEEPVAGHLTEVVVREEAVSYTHLTLPTICSV
eukprot:3639718-Prorocentrum_lima.AAC.1